MLGLNIFPKINVKLQTTISFQAVKRQDTKSKNIKLIKNTKVANKVIPKIFLIVFEKPVLKTMHKRMLNPEKAVSQIQFGDKNTTTE